MVGLVPGPYFLVLNGKWGSEYKYHYGAIYWDYVGSLIRIHSSIQPSAPESLWIPIITSI